MDFLIKVAETGLAFPYTNIPGNEKVSYLQAKIKTDTRIEIKDQILITKRGYRVQPSDILSSLEKDNLFQTTINNPQNFLKSVFIIYVFDHRRFSEKPSSREKLAPYFLDANENLKNYLIEAKIIEKDFPLDFQAQVAGTPVLENIKSINPEILETEIRLYTHWNNMKKKFLQYKSKTKKLQRLMEESQNQLQSFDVLLKYASMIYKPCKTKKNDVLKRFTQDQEKNQNVLKIFEESLENLKKIELHEALQSERHKTLMDIYYNPDAMYKWKNTCIDMQNNIKTRIEKSATLIKTIKKKLTEEKERTTELIKNQFQVQNINIDSLIQEGEGPLRTLLLKVYGDYKWLRETLEEFLQDGNNKEEKLKDPKFDNFTAAALEEEIANINKSHEKIDKVLDQLTKIKNSFETPIIVFYNTIMRYVGELNMISNEKMRQLNEEIDKMEKDFSYLLNPSHLPNGYKASLSEVSRRKEFSATFFKKFKKLKALTEAETEKRKKFLAQYGKVLPSEFIPQLKHMPPLITLENSEADSNLPNITNMHPVERKSSEERRSSSGKKRGDESSRQNYESKAEAQKMKEDEELKNLRRKMEEIIKDFESQKERNRVLKTKLNEVEKDQLSSSLRKDIANDKSSRQRENLELKEDLDQLAKVVSKSLASMEIQDAAFGGFEIVKDKENIQSGEKSQLLQKIEVLILMVENVSKTAFGVFSRNLNEKQKRFDDIRSKYESLLMKTEENLQKETSRIETHYEAKIRELIVKYSEAQKRVALLLEDNKRYQKELNEVKADSYEKGKYYQSELENIKKDIKIKLDLLKSKDEIIRSLTDIKNNQSKEMAELQDKMKKIEQKIKSEHLEALNSVHNAHKEEVEGYKAKLKGIERDLSNKKIEVEKLVFSLGQCEKDTRQKEEQVRKHENTVATLNEKITKMHDELAGYKNKIDNMELTMQKKTTELNTATKTVSQLTSEKNSLANDLSTYKEFNSELTRKLQSLNEAWKKSETEKKTLKTENEKLLLDAEKKQVEIQNLQEQIAQVNRERKEQVMELSKITENHQTERTKITELQEELNQKNIEINTLKTKLDLLALDLDNKVKENDNLLDKLESLEKERERNEEALLKVKDELDKEKSNAREAEQKCEDLRVVCEQLQIEMDLKNDKCEELKRFGKELLERAEKAEANWAQSVKENEALSKQNFSRSSESNEKIQELNEKIMRLEEELTQKDKELKEKEEELIKSRAESSKIQARVDELANEHDKQKRSFKEREDLVKSLEDQMRSSQKIISELEKQEDSYKEEVRNKQSEVDELKRQFAEVNQELEKIRNENFLLSSELSSQKSRFETTITKYHFQEQSKLDYLKVETGAKLLFIPYSAGIYVPFTLRQYQNHEIQSILRKGTVELDPEVFKATESSIKPSFFLDLDSLNETYQNILKDCSLLIVASVKSIKPKLNKEINSKEESLMIEVERIEYMVGFEDEDMILKNYAITINCEKIEKASNSSSFVGKKVILSA